MTEIIRDTNGRHRIRRAHDGKSYDEHQQERHRMAFRCVCRSCEQQFETNDAFAIECPTCLARREQAERQTEHMATPDSSWRWSRAAMRERLGVSGDVDE